MSSLGTLDYALLGILAEKPLNGYDLQKRFEAGLANAWAAGYSQIYPALGKLADAGLIEVVESGTRNSRVYGPTKAGMGALRAWLHTDTQRVVRNEAVLRLFFLWLLEPNDAASRLGEEETYHREMHEHYCKIEERLAPKTNSAGRWSRIMLERGMRFEAMMADWARWARAELARDEETQAQ